MFPCVLASYRIPSPDQALWLEMPTMNRTHFLLHVWKTIRSVDVPPFAVCTPSRPARPSNNPRSVQENGISDGARRRPVAQWNACVLWVHALPRFVLSTAGRLSASGMGETVRLHFGARRFTGDGRMKVNGVFLSPCFLLFQGPMSADAAESTAQNSESARRHLRSLKRRSKGTLCRRPSVCGVRSESPRTPL